MRYLVKGKLKSGKEKALLAAIEAGTLGSGSVAGDEYLRDIAQARKLDDGQACWVEVCYCNIPLEEELPYWEEFFEIVSIKNAHAREKCKDLNGSVPWTCNDCDCTERLESRMKEWGTAFMDTLSPADSDRFQP
jgi:hypothetical protein